jgi:hypothetical protein
VRVAAAVKSTTRNGFQYRHFGLTDDRGRVEGDVEGGARFDLVALTEDGAVLGFGGRDLEADPGGRIEGTIQLSTGSLVIVLPASIAVPERGNISLALKPAQGDTQYMEASTLQAPSRMSSHAVWEGASVRFAEVGSGAYEARVTIERIDKDADRPGNWRRTKLHDPVTVKVVVEEGREAKIVVP